MFQTKIGPLSPEELELARLYVVYYQAFNRWFNNQTGENGRLMNAAWAAYSEYKNRMQQ